MPRSTTAPVSTETAIEALYMDDVPAASDANAMSDAIVKRILSAESIEDVLAGPGELKSAEDIAGQLITLHDVEFRESDFEGSPVYAILTVSQGGGNAFMVTCGARNVMAAAFTLKKRDALPIACGVVAGKQTKAGFTPLWLVSPDKIVDANGQKVVYDEPAFS